MITRTFYRHYSVFKVQTSYEASLCQRAFGDLIIERNGNMHGIGKPEPLQYDLQGLYSRRIDDKNRLVYVADGEGLFIVSCRYHYE
ncbi:MAG: Txe/YoeB family addiction module toxin [Lachnospiraceae bacterium]|nr:Txe/YoeB family addiction module toxin [Lachnospiraceae bacterium]